MAESRIYNADLMCELKLVSRYRDKRLLAIKQNPHNLSQELW